MASFNFEEGLNTADQVCASLFTKANDTIQKAMQQDVDDILRQYPWDHVRGYLHSCYSQMADQIYPAVTGMMEEWAEGEGGYTQWAASTFNSESAIEYAKRVSDKAISYGAYLRDYQVYVREYEAPLTKEEAKYDDHLEELLTNSFQTALESTEDGLATYSQRINEAADENQFLAPLTSIPEIVFGCIKSWFEQLLNSVAPFCDGCREIIEQRSNAAKDSAEAAKQRASQSAQMDGFTQGV